MTRMKNGLLKGLAITLGSVLPATLLAGCATETNEPASSEQVSESAAELGVAVATCSSGTGYNAMTSTLAIAMTTPSVVVGVVGGYVTVNGYACLKSAGGAQLTPSLVKKITVTGTGANNEKVVIDMLSGSFGPTVLATTGGIVVDLGAGTGDGFSLRGTSGADKYTAGKSGSDSYFEVSGDTIADIRVIGAESMALSLSGGADVFSGRGGALTATHLAGSTITTLAALSADIVVNGGDGDDIITGGDGNDTLSGGNGNDLFKTSTGATGDGADTYAGNAGTDKIDYSGRTADLIVAMDGTTSSGQGASGAEADIVGTDVEDLIGGTGNDTLSGNTGPNNIQGGAGNDILWGGAAGTCLTDIDLLDGGAGNDTFKMTATADCGDALTGGLGTDIADYQLRTGVLNISLDNGANDGESAEKDNVKSDIEVVLGGSAADVLVGSSANDELHGGPSGDTISGGGGDDKLVGDSGNDTLNGEAGNDTFDDGAVDSYYTTTEQKGTGGDIMNGGTGFDTVDYSARTNAITATICMDAAKLTGNTALTAANCVDSDGEASEADKIVNVTHMIGGSAIDHLTGSTADDTLEGGDGNDVIHGGLGSDTLYGDNDDDSLFGDAGDDYLDGGAGDDALEGDTTAGTNLADGDICISDAADTTAAASNCDL
jgi:Ca2+-binding RTX toxin-like protein